MSLLHLTGSGRVHALRFTKPRNVVGMLIIVQAFRKVHQTLLKLLLDREEQSSLELIALTKRIGSSTYGEWFYRELFF